MRKLLWLLAAAACLAALPAVGQDRASNLLTNYLDQAGVAPSVQVGRVTFFPIVLKQTRELDLITMDQALRRGVLSIEELDSADVNQARFVNRDTRDTIFVMAGEIIAGGKQNRTLATDALLAPGASTVLPIYCVQRGRWEGNRDFSKAPSMAPQAVREKAAAGASQRELWDEVARANDRLGGANRSEDLAEAMTKGEAAKRIPELRGRVVPSLPGNAAGVVVAVDGRIVGADLFNSARLFGLVRDEVVDSYLSQYGLDDRLAGGGARVDQAAVRDYLQACYRGDLGGPVARGVGEVYQLSGGRWGTVLAYNGAVRPMDDRLRDRPIRVSPVMVHASLMDRQRVIVPVAPPPVRRVLPEPRMRAN